jgi:hypothetical protein
VLASLLDAAFPTQDPSHVKASKVPQMIETLDEKFGKTDTEEVLKEWKKLYEGRLHESAYEEMAPAGELCDGELPSWTHARLSVEIDRDYVVPDVSAHEAKVRILSEDEKKKNK